MDPKRISFLCRLHPAVAVSLSVSVALAVALVSGCGGGSSCQYAQATCVGEVTVLYESTSQPAADIPVVIAVTKVNHLGQERAEPITLTKNTDENGVVTHAETFEVASTEKVAMCICPVGTASECVFVWTFDEAANVVTASTPRLVKTATLYISD